MLCAMRFLPLSFLLISVCAAQKRHIHILQRQKNLTDFSEDAKCNTLVTMAPNFWSSNRFSQCVPLARRNGVQQFAIQLDLDKLPAEQKTYDPFVIEWLVSRMLNNYTGNCQTTVESKRQTFDASRTAIILVGPENDKLCDSLIGTDVGMGEIIRCKPRDVTTATQVQDVKLTSYLINVDVYVDKWIAFEFAEQMNLGLDRCRYNAYPLKPE